MTPILVIGRHGQLARSLSERASARSVPVVHAGRPELDLLDPRAVAEIAAGTGARTIVNTSAYTAVDQAEDEPGAASALNVGIPASLAEAARQIGARLIHISTDYVFDGSGAKAWTETDAPAPASVYGRTKLEGEAAVRDLLPEGHAIVRTSWLYSPFGQNFVRTMLNVGAKHREVRVVGDQIGNPTSALDLADAILTMVDQWEANRIRCAGGVYHFAGSGTTSWADFAREIFSISAARGGPSAAVTPIATSEWPAKAPRPANSQLDCSLFARTFGYWPPAWRDSLATVVSRLIPADPYRG